jgi:phage/plasmid-like protein (TIGR03299 family)
MSTITMNPNPFALLGEDVKDTTGLEPKMKAGGADFECRVRPTFTTIEDADGNEVVIESSKVAVVRLDTQTILGEHSAKYRYQPFSEVAKIAQEIVDLRGAQGAEITTIGTFDGGRKLFINIFMGEQAIDPFGVNDVFHPFITGFSSHDASLPNIFREGNIRLACNNMLTMIRDGKHSLEYCIKHTKHMVERIVHATRSLVQADEALETYVTQAETLQRVQVSLNKVDRLITQLYGVPEGKRGETIAKARRDTIVEIFEGPTCVGALGSTGWAAYNALTEYVDHHRPDNTTEERAVLSLTPNSWADKFKRTAGVATLALAA